MNRKLISGLLATVLVFSMNVSTFATTSTHDGYAHGITSVDNEVITPELKKEIQADILKSDLSLQNNKVSTQSTCNHSWSAWKVLNRYKERGPTIDSCAIQVVEYYRYCTKCNEMQAKVQRTQLQHHWIPYGGGKKCTNCGKTIIPVK